MSILISQVLKPFATHAKHSDYRIDEILARSKLWQLAILLKNHQYLIRQ